ncbi:MAG: hemolysin family protein [Oscillospiraceae bacterium]
MDNLPAAITAIIILIAFSALFSSMETAISSVNKIRLKHEAANGKKSAQRTLKLAENFDKTITSILVGNNVVNILLSSLGTVVFTNLMGASGVAVSTAVITVLVLTFGEILPKSIAKQNSESYAEGTSGLLGFICWLLTPISFLFLQLQKLTSKIFKPKENAPSVTEDELKYIIDEIEDEGVLEKNESTLVRSALEFDDTTCEEILIPRVKVSAVDITDSIDEIRDMFINERYSRLPVYEKSIDNIIGFITDKDFFALLFGENGGKPVSVESIVQKALYVHESKLISELLVDMQRSKIHIAVVKDDYGGTSGIVTMEDIIEELVGEIYDENDEVVQSIVKVGEDMYEIQADLSLGDMLEKLGLPENIIDVDSFDSNTVGGWALELFGYIPPVGANVTSGIFNVTVLEGDERTISKIGLKIDKTDDTETE